MAERFGRVGVIAETGSSLGPAGVAVALAHRLRELWDVELLWLEEPAKAEPWDVPLPPDALVLKSAVDLQQDYGRASRLYEHLRCQGDRYDAFVFVGLRAPTLSLLPVTRGKNCAVAMVPTTFNALMRERAASWYSLLNCDYLIAHSEAEAALLRQWQPHADVRHVPILCDRGWPYALSTPTEERPLRIASEGPLSVLVSETCGQDTVDLLHEMRARFGQVLLVSDTADHGIADAVATVHQFSMALPEIRPRITAAVVSMREQFLPMLYNLAQYDVPMHLAGHRDWLTLLDGQTPRVKDTAGEPSWVPLAPRLLPAGYHHADYYANYLVHFVSEWCMNSVLRQRSPGSVPGEFDYSRTPTTA